MKEPMLWPNMKYGNPGYISFTSFVSLNSSSIMVWAPLSPQSPQVPLTTAVLPWPTWSSAATMKPASMNATIMWK